MTTRRNDPEASRASILEAAERLFLEKGFAGASMSDISKISGVTKSLIHHHFGSKETLWNEVKRRRFADYHVQQMALFERTADSVELVRESLRVYFKFLRERPEMVRMMWWMLLEHDVQCNDMVEELCRVGIDRIAQAQRAGLFRGDIEPRFVLAIFLGIVRAFFSDPQLRGAEVDADAYVEAAWKIFAEGVLPR